MSSVPVVRPKNAQRMIERCFDVSKPCFLWGPPGIGKSRLIESIGVQYGRPIIDMRLILCEPTDLKGIPYFDPNSSTMQWARPAELPDVVNYDDLDIAKRRLDIYESSITDEAALDEERTQVLTRLRTVYATLTESYELRNAILLLDELNSAPGSVQGAAYQLVLDRKIGNYELPAGVSIIAAGNRENDKGTTYRMPSPLANRFVHLEMETNFDDWQAWAIKAGVHSDVIGFLNASKESLFSFNPNDKAFPTPRSWETVSKLIDGIGDDDLILSLVAGTVGSGKATEFNEHRKVAKFMPIPEDILSGKVTTLDIDKNATGPRYSLVVNLCYTMKNNDAKLKDKTDTYSKDDWNEHGSNMFAFFMDNLSKEMCVLGALIAIRTFDLDFDSKACKSFNTFVRAYTKYLID